MNREDILKKNIVIYGVGVNGKWVYHQLKKEGYSVNAFLDDNHYEPIEGVSVWNEEEFAKSQFCNENTTVIISFYVKNREILNAITKRLVSWNVKAENIYHFIELFMDSYFEKEKLAENKCEIEKAYGLLEEEKSKVLFSNYIRGIEEGDAKVFEEPTEEEQYFDYEIMPNLNDKEAYFVDCGAYIGDTFDTLKKKKLNMKYVGFEPDINNFCRLGETVKSHRKKAQPILFPCATADTNKLVRFSYSDEKTDSPGSAISESGNITVPAVSLDSVIAGLEISLLKMDVEGAEKDSLHGAKWIIQEKHPDLAICVYHKTEDIWELINLIHSYYPGYRFYLRSYYLFSRETVLYAINE